MDPQLQAYDPNTIDFSNPPPELSATQLKKLKALRSELRANKIDSRLLANLAESDIEFCQKMVRLCQRL